MAQINWDAIASGQSSRKKRYAGANVKFFYAYNENRVKSIEAGRPIFDEIPSISIRWPGHDETVRRIEPQDIAEYPEEYARFKAGTEPVTEGTPLAEWPLMSGSPMREIQYLGFKTVEQLAKASDEVKRKLGPLVKYVKLAEEWLKAADSTQGDVVKLKQLLDVERKKREYLEERLEILMQRVEANEGTDLRPTRKVQSIELDQFDAEVQEEELGVDGDVADKEPAKVRGRTRRR